MKKLIGTLIIGLLLSFGVIGVSAKTVAPNENNFVAKQNKMRRMRKMRMMRHHRHHRHHRRHMK